MGLFGKKKQETEYASAEKRNGLSAEPLPDADNIEENEVSAAVSWSVRYPVTDRAWS